jgi:Domain of unknown function (DUF397)
VNEMSWRKSSHSNGHSQCVEVSWGKSSHSRSGACAGVGYTKSSYSYANGNCVETGIGSCGMVHVRDSKNPAGGVLSFTRADWQGFVDSLKGQA